MWSAIDTEQEAHQDKQRPQKKKKVLNLENDLIDHVL